MVVVVVVSYIIQDYKFNHFTSAAEVSSPGSVSRSSIMLHKCSPKNSDKIIRRKKVAFNTNVCIVVY